MKLTKYRIVVDIYAGYEVQKWRLWFPFWIQVRVNTFATVEAAKAFIERDKGGVVWMEGQENENT
jgi:hypothetical protein